MSDYEEGLKGILLAHYRSPRGHPVDGLSGVGCVERRNRTCGDRVTVRAVVTDRRLVRLEYAAEGCAVTTGLASVFSTTLPGKPVGELVDLVNDLLKALDDAGDPDAELRMRAGDAVAALAVRALPTRRACARIVLEAVREAVETAEGVDAG